ncbi:MAG: glycosyltransferase, partial [Actinobacteria bacterium]|nr:glycosyltransferase [Actinomycetota bacterium]
MKIAINTLPLQTGHRNFNHHFYTKNLLEEFEKDSSLTILKFTDSIKLANVDIVHYPWYDLFFRSLPLWTKCPLIVSVHDVIPLVFPDYYLIGVKGRVNHLLQRFALRRCRFVITDSQKSKKDIIKHLGLKDSKVAVVPLAAGVKY